MSRVVVRSMGPAVEMQFLGIYPIVKHRLSGVDIGVTLTREEAVDLHAKLVAALWNDGPSPIRREDDRDA